MALTLQEQDILKRLEEFGLRNEQTEQTAVYGQVMPSAGSYFFLGPYAALLKGQYFVLCLDEDRVILLPLGRLSGKIDKKLDPVIIPFQDLEEVKLKDGKLMQTVTLIGDGVKLPLKLSKVAVGLGWHKRNLPNVWQQLQAVSRA